jgi:hypothetical protein
MAALTGCASFYDFSAVWVGDYATLLFYYVANRYTDV